SSVLKSIPSLVSAVAIPRPCSSGSTNHPISHPVLPFHSVSQYPTLPAGELREPAKIVNWHPACGSADIARNLLCRFRICYILYCYFICILLTDFLSVL